MSKEEILKLAKKLLTVTDFSDDDSLGGDEEDAEEVKIIKPLKVEDKNKMDRKKEQTEQKKNVTALDPLTEEEHEDEENEEEVEDDDCEDEGEEADDEDECNTEDEEKEMSKYVNEARQID